MNKTILIADDDPAIVDALKFTLEDEGFLVETTVDGRTVAEARQVYPDCIILDIWMSGVDGRAIARELKSRPDTKGIPIIMISANNDSATLALESGADAFIAKPFDIDVLISQVTSFVGP